MTQNINSNTVKRLIKDVKEILNYSSKDNNIYYKHHDTDMLTGYALIIGNSDTPYQYGNYLFKFIFPTDYPFTPPKVIFLTNDSICRYHPNLYKNGRCCLSILNTWQGDQWTSCQTILSVLLTLSSILQNNPLVLEPGIKLSHPDVSRYNEIITYKNFDFAIKDIIDYTYNPNNSMNKIFKNNTELTYAINLFIDDIKYNFNKNKINIIQKINTNNKNSKYKIYASIYGLDIYINYNLLINEFNKIEI